MLSNIALLLSLTLPFLAWAFPSGTSHGLRQRQRPGHVQVSKRQNTTEVLDKRFSAARWTFYDVGLGACGKTNSASDFIVALNSAQFGGGYPGPHCFQTITMTYNGKTTQATIMDECPGCPYGGLDLSRGLFDFFAAESAGVVYGQWDFGGSSNPPPPTTTKQPPAPQTTPTKQVTTTPKPKPTSTPAATPTSQSSTPTPTSQSPSTPTSHSPSIGISIGISVSPTPSASPSPAPVANSGNLGTLYDVFISLGQITVAGASV